MTDYTLIEAINLIPEDKTLYIASRSAFFFIGDRKSWNENKEKINRKWLNSYYKSYLNTESTLRNLGTTPIKIQNTLAGHYKCFKDRFNANMIDEWGKELEVEVALRIRAVKKAAANFRNAVQRFDDFTLPFDNRRVIEIIPKDEIIDPNGVQIVIEGDEAGSYWLKEESPYYHDRREENIRMG